MSETGKDRPVVIITGAVGGIGREIVRKYLENGYQVIMVDLNGASLAQTVALLGFPSEQTDCWALDITKEEDVEEMISSVY